MNTKTFSIEHLNRIKAPANKVYHALTTSEGLAEVWTLELLVKPEIGFVTTIGVGCFIA